MMSRCHATTVLPMIAGALCLATPSWADFQTGLRAYNFADYATAIRELRPYADQGDAAAQFYLGAMYDKGKGTQQDHAQAVFWYRKAAEQGHAEAQVNLGTLYLEGGGVPRDYTEALKWLQAAAVKGQSLAYDKLGHIHAKGLGVPKDYVQAHMWYNLAAAKGDFGAAMAAMARDSLAKKMTPAQVAEAQRLAQEWHSTNKQ